MEKQDHSKLPGYYEEIPCPWEKKEELLRLFSDQTVEVHAYGEKDYDYLEENGVVLIIKNPFGDYDLEIELGAEFTLYFAGWHTHYFDYVYDYHQMIQTVEDILANRRFVAFLSRNGEWYGSSLEEAPITVDDFLNRQKQDPICPSTDEQIAEIKQAVLDFQLRYWKPAE